METLWYLYVLTLVSFIPITLAYKVGLLLNSDNPGEVDAIKRLAAFTLSELNEQNTTLEVEVQYHDTTYLSLKNGFCALLDLNVVAIVSAGDYTLTDIQANLANQFHIPLIAAVATDPFTEVSRKDDFEIRLSPSDVHQSRAIFDLLKEYKWFQFSILASADNYGINSIVHLQYLASQDDNFSIRDVQHFDVRINLSSKHEVPLFKKELQLIKDSLAKVIVLNCGGKFAKRIFKEAKKMGLMDESFVWITTDGIAARPESIAYQSSVYPTFYNGLLGTLPHFGKGSEAYNTLTDTYIMAGGLPSDLRMSSVKIAMGLTVLHASLKELDRGSWNSSPRINCKAVTQWDGGQILYSKINDNLNNGMHEYTGAKNPSYDIVNFKDTGFQKVGTWKNSIGLVNLKDEKVRWVERDDVLFFGGEKSPPTGIGDSLSGYHLKIGIVPEPPIAFLRDHCVGGDTSSPNCWYGWNPDIIVQLQKDLNFTYEYVRPEGDKYGGFDNNTRTWNGMVKDILDRKIDLTLALSINSERLPYIDYTSSIYEDQASLIVYTTSSFSSTNLFFFLEPFEISVWLSIIGLILAVACLTTFVSKVSPFGNYGRKIHAMQVCPCSECKSRRETKAERKCRFVDTKTYSCLVERVQEHDDLLELSYYNSAWLVGTGFVQQGTDTLPTSPSGRFLLFIWWLFIMIMTSMYTANLTAHLTLDRSTTTIRALEDLLGQSEYTWGLVQDRSLEAMMSNHENRKYNEIADKAVKLQDLAEGIARVKEGGFVFLDESSVLTYNFKNDCKTVLVKTGKFNNQWAFGAQVNSPYTAVINRMFLQYRERGWFTSKFDEWYSSGEDQVPCAVLVGSNNKFDLHVLLGLFLILGVGTSISFVTVFLEMLYVARQDSVELGKSFGYCLRSRIEYKYREVTEEWFARSKNNLYSRLIMDRQLSA